MPGPTAYFLFCQEHRAEEKERLLSDGREKVNVAEVAKALGEKWKALSDEQKAEWKAKAEEARAAMPQPEEGAEEEQGEDAEAKAGTSRPDHLPLSTVRKVRERERAASGSAVGAVTEVAICAVCYAPAMPRSDPGLTKRNTGLFETFW